MSQSRRDLLKVSAAGVAALSHGVYAFGSSAPPNGEIDVRLTVFSISFLACTPELVVRDYAA